MNAGRRPPLDSPADPRPGHRPDPRPGARPDPRPVRTRWQSFLNVVATILVRILVRCYFRCRVDGLERLPPGPSVLCISHQSWVDPFVLMAVLPLRPRFYVFGPKEEDMREGRRNRFIALAHNNVAYKPGKNDLLDTTRRVQRVLGAGYRMAISGEGRIHAGEETLLPFNDGAAYFALRCRVPVVAVGINGLSWLKFGRVVRIRIGEPIACDQRPTRAVVGALTERLWHETHALTRGYPETARTRGFGGWLTELFNDWPEGYRPDQPH